MRDKGESGWLSAIYHVIHEGLLISQAALRQRLVSRRYPLPETGNPFVSYLGYPGYLRYLRYPDTHGDG